MPECPPCPAAAGYAPSAGIKSMNMGGDGNQDPCSCRSCCCGQKPVIKPCYKQPRIPQSYAPTRCYMKPTTPLEGNTTYKMSYLPNCNIKNLRMEVMKPSSNLVFSQQPMEGHTVQKLSYLPNPVCQTQPIRPCHHDMWGQGPMQSITTQRHDYVPKPCIMRENFKPPHKIHNVETPFENRTINRMSYIPPDRQEPVKSFAPERCYERPVAKMDTATTHKMSYLPNDIRPKEPLPWVCKGQYVMPCQKLETNTVYKMSYLDAKADCRRMPIVPTACNNPVTASTGFDSTTVYKSSYLPARTAMPVPMKPKENLTFSTAAMDGDTVHKLSYLPNPVCQTQPIKPCHHDMWGQGPMQNITTQRHDYVPKPFMQTTNFKPPHKFHNVEMPFENRTVNRMSYLDPGLADKVTSFAPTRCYEKPSAKMDCSTTHKMSYQPVCVQQPQKPPWSCVGQYVKPCQKLESTTIYKSSFLPPGEDCTEIMDPCQYGDCKPCTCSCPAQCISQNPCACDFPKAACCN